MLRFYSKKNKFVVSVFNQYGFWCAEFVHLTKIPVIDFTTRKNYYTVTEIKRKYKKDFKDVLPDAFYMMQHGYCGMYLKEYIDKLYEKKKV